MSVGEFDPQIRTVVKPGIFVIYPMIGKKKNRLNNKFEVFEARFWIPDLRIRFWGGNFT